MATDDDLASLDDLVGPVDIHGASVEMDCGGWTHVLPEIPRRIYCDGREHRLVQHDKSDGLLKVRRDSDALARRIECPAHAARRQAAERATCIEDARAELGGILARLEKNGGSSFDDFDVAKHDQAGIAREAMERFAADPTSNVLLVGTTGLGKTHLLCASHLALVARGIRSRFVTVAQLRKLFRDATNFTGDVAHPALAEIARLNNAQALHIDDLGDVGDGKPGQFMAGLKEILDNTRAAIAVATNLGTAQLSAHPDVGDRNLSRLVEGATVVRLTGEDQRLRSTIWRIK